MKTNKKYTIDIDGNILKNGKLLSNCLDELNELDYNLNRDGLTGCYSRYRLNKDLQHVPIKLAIIYIDINNLKITNDTEGHLVGDNLIKTVVNEVKPFGDVYRQGGDEFILLTMDNEIKKFKEKFKDTALFSYGCVYSDEYATYKEGIILADNRMYKNKIENKASILSQNGKAIDCNSVNISSNLIG